MLRLSYSACYDPYNTIFRMLAVLKRSPNQTMNAEVLCVADFFVCFPKRLSEIRPPNSVEGMRGRNNSVMREEAKREYELLPSSNVLFERMEVIQETALSAMKANNLVSIQGKSESRIIKLNTKAIPEVLEKKVDQFTTRHSELIDLVARDFSAIQIHGSNGLKARTGLGEYIYDTV